MVNINLVNFLKSIFAVFDFFHEFICADRLLFITLLCIEVLYYP